MRSNLPVTQHEYTFPAGETLVSTTDLKGRITYVNPSFVVVSGYAKEELLGQPHNMIRHPDMPEEAFRDMWETIASGRPWSAMVKNRRKDGDHYWVMANVTPLMEGERPIGYMSVRTEPQRSQIEAASALYAQMRQAETQGGLRVGLAAGHLQRRDFRGRLVHHLTPGARGRSMAFAIALGIVGLATGLTLESVTGTLNAGVILAAASIAFALGIAAGWWLDRQTHRPLERVLRFANRMAAGDLSATLDTRRRDLVGQVERALNQLSVNVRSIVRDARNEVEQMRTATGEIAAGNHDLSSRTESQASSLQQTAASMEQITGTVQQSAGSAREAAGLAREATATTERSSAAVLEVTHNMQTISDASRRIADIIQVIDGIAFQTNILALNAAVEAARAGEQGRGFAVVAGEVRALAQRTTTAAREVKTLIGDSAAKVEVGARLTANARQTMEEALATVNRVAALIQEIDTSASEQLTGISQVNEAVADLDRITQQNAAMVEQIAASATSLRAQADGVAESVGVFRLNGDAAHAPDAVSMRRAMKARAA